VGPDSIAVRQVVGNTAVQQAVVDSIAAWQVVAVDNILAAVTASEQQDLLPNQLIDRQEVDRLPNWPIVAVDRLVDMAAVGADTADMLVDKAVAGTVVVDMPADKLVDMVVADKQTVGDSLMSKLS
jgi:hypothetical protein